MRQLQKTMGVLFVRGLVPRRMRRRPGNQQRRAEGRTAAALEARTRASARASTDAARCLGDQSRGHDRLRIAGAIERVGLQGRERRWGSGPEDRRAAQEVPDRQQAATRAAPSIPIRSGSSAPPSSRVATEQARSRISAMDRVASCDAVFCRTLCLRSTAEVPGRVIRSPGRSASAVPDDRDLKRQRQARARRSAVKVARVLQLFRPFADNQSPGKGVSIVPWTACFSGDDLRR